jgi:hypothetical protein
VELATCGRMSVSRFGSPNAGVGRVVVGRLDRRLTRVESDIGLLGLGQRENAASPHSTISSPSCPDRGGRCPPSSSTRRRRGSTAASSGRCPRRAPRPARARSAAGSGLPSLRPLTVRLTNWPPSTGTRQMSQRSLMSTAGLSFTHPTTWVGGFDDVRVVLDVLTNDRARPAVMLRVCPSRATARGSDRCRNRGSTGRRATRRCTTARA